MTSVYENRTSIFGQKRLKDMNTTKRYIFWIAGFIALLAVCVMGDVITLGDKLMSASSVLGWAFYILVAALFTGLIVKPCLQVLLTPEITGIETIDEEKHHELKTIVMESAKVSLLMTTVSQNGSIDIVANTAITFKLIGQLVKTAGYRPTLPQLLRLYSSVITTSLIVASVDEVIDNLDLAGLVGNAGAGAICKIFQPLANGAANAYTCMRVGYATIKYLKCGSKAYNSDKAMIRKAVAKEARRDLIPVMKAEVKDIISNIR